MKIFLTKSILYAIMQSLSVFLYSLGLLEFEVYGGSFLLTFHTEVNRARLEVFRFLAKPWS